jgi:hypothetical protein
VPRLRQMWQKCRTYYAKHGAEYANWAAVFEGWIVIQYERDTGMASPTGAMRGASLSKHVEAVSRKNKNDAEALAGAIGGLFAIEGGKR